MPIMGAIFDLSSVEILVGCNEGFVRAKEGSSSTFKNHFLLVWIMIAKCRF